MTTKRNVVLYLDEELIEKSRALGLNFSRAFENHLKQLINQLSNQQSTQKAFQSENKSLMVGLPGFEPGSIEPKSTSLDQTSRQPHAIVSFAGNRWQRKIISYAP
jgi:post-segregation antitoxin (ccd killing protein)